MCKFCSFYARVFHITPFFELSLVLLTTKALGLYEFTFGQKWPKKWHFEWPNQNSKTTFIDTVYNAEFFFVTSYNLMAWVVKRTKLNSKKGVMWNTLLYIPSSFILIDTENQIKKRPHTIYPVSWQFSNLFDIIILTPGQGEVDLCSLLQSVPCGSSAVNSLADVKNWSVLLIVIG